MANCGKYRVCNEAGTSGWCSACPKATAGYHLMARRGREERGQHWCGGQEKIVGWCVVAENVVEAQP